MKKTMLALFLAGSCSAAMAQVTGDSTTNRNQTQTQTQTQTQNQTVDQTQNSKWNTTPTTNTSIQGNQHKMHQNSMTTTGDYNAYGTTSVSIPSTVQVYFDRDYPNAGEITWRRKGDWYYATYNKMGRYQHVYYNERGDTYTVALPVTQNYVPDDIVTKAGNMYGDMIYDISSVKGQNGQNIYHIRTIEGDQLRSNWVGEDGTNITDPFRPADSLAMQNNMNTNMNSNSGNNMNATTTDSSANMNNMNHMNTTDSSMNRTDTSGKSQHGNIPDGSNQDGSKNNKIPENQKNTMDYAILPQGNDLRKKA
jgi:hypothetical protein